MSQFNFIGNFLGKKADPSKDGHDMSAQFAYSSNFGTINVVDCIDVVPNEHYRCNYSGYIQTAPMREDNFSTIRSNMKAIFVPRTSMMRNYMDLMMHGADNGTNPRETRKNIQFDYPVGDFSLPVQNFLSFLFPAYFLNRWYEEICASVDDVYNMFYDYTDHQFYYNSDDGSQQVIQQTTVSLQLLDRVLRDSSPLVIPSSFSFGFVFDKLIDFTRSRSSNSICFDGLRLLDNFNYGNYIPVFDNVYKYAVSQILSDSSSTHYIQFITGYGDLVYNPNMGFTRSFFEFISPYHRITRVINPLHLYEYQFYINTCERSNYRNPSVRVLTLDSILSNVTRDGFTAPWYFSTQGTGPVVRQKYFVFRTSTDAADYQISSFRLQVDTESDSSALSSRLFYSDFYAVNTYGSMYEASLDVLPYLSNPSFELYYLFSLSNPLLQPDLFTTMQQSVVSGNIPTVAGSVDVQSLNDLSAAYKLQQDLLRAGVRRDQQMKSLFGVGTEDLTNDIYVLDQSSNNIAIQGLLNQAETEVAELGERGARGNGSSGLNFTFDSKDYGSIIIVQYFTCELMYESFCIHKLNRIGFSQDWMPQFNNLGLEAVKSSDCSVLRDSYATSNFITHFLDNVDDNHNLGFSVRYYERKQRLSLARGLFTNFGFSANFGLNDSGTPVNPWRRNFALVRGNGAFGGFVPTLIEQQTNLFENESDLYYSPTMVNNLFTTMNDGGAHGSFEYDQFRCILNAAVHKVSPMPKVGLLRLI